MAPPSPERTDSRLVAWIGQILHLTGTGLVLVAGVLGAVGAHVVARGRSPLVAFVTAALLAGLGVAHRVLAARLAHEPDRVLRWTLGLAVLEGSALNGVGLVRGASAPEHVAVWAVGDALWLAVIAAVVIARRRLARA